MADELLELLSHLGEDAGRLADLVLGVPEPDARLLLPARLVQLARAELCTPDAVPYAGRSCAAMVLAAAVVQSASLVVSWPPELLAVAGLPSAESQEELELQPELWAAAQRADALEGRSAQRAES